MESKNQAVHDALKVLYNNAIDTAELMNDGRVVHGRVTDTGDFTVLWSRDSLPDAIYRLLKIVSNNTPKMRLSAEAREKRRANMQKARAVMLANRRAKQERQEKEHAEDVRFATEVLPGLMEKVEQGRTRRTIASCPQDWLSPAANPEDLSNIL